MTTTLCELTQDDVDLLLELSYNPPPGEQIVLSNGFRLQTIDHVEFYNDFRWAYTNLAVYMHAATGRFYGFEYEIDKTEMGDNWSYIKPQLVLVDRIPTYTYKEIG